MKTIAQILIDELKAYMEKPPTATQLPKRILIVDDSEDYAQMMREVLKSEGYDVFTAQEPKDAVKAIASTVPYSRVFLDMNFPGSQTGIKTLEQIRSIFPNLPVTIISGFVDDNFEIIAKSYGFSVLNKGTLDLADLKNIIEHDHKKPSGS